MDVSKDQERKVQFCNDSNCERFDEYIPEAGVSTSSAPTLSEFCETDELMTVVDELFEIANIKNVLLKSNSEIRFCHTKMNALNYSTTFLQQCESIANDLESERRIHAEELRLINQDVNFLEGLIKNVVKIHQRQQCSLRKQIYSLRESMKVLENDEVFKTSNMEPPTLQSLLPDIPAQLRSVLEESHTYKNRNQLCVSQKEKCNKKQPEVETCAKMIHNSNSITPAKNSIFNDVTKLHFLENYKFNPEYYQNFIGTDIHTKSKLAKPFSIPVPIASPHIFHDDADRLKLCLVCQRKIHRNAPTCPFCKTKITSKASKRKRK